MLRRSSAELPIILLRRYWAWVTTLVVPRDVLHAAGWTAELIVPRLGRNSRQARTPAPQRNWSHASSGSAAWSSAARHTPSVVLIEPTESPVPALSKTSRSPSFVT